ncbi:hypothetical protein NC651_018059 [Populus alba x Populus x berolinensis]|nr:hypothetical protein NC651_018059 [Populus alba x Populus x berolinensis]
MVCLMLVISRRPSSGHILEALHIDPASGVSPDNDKSTKVSKPAVSASSGLAKLAKASTSGGPLKQQQGEKKETPQERLKRIMSKQLNKQIKKDTATEMAKKREQERHRQEKLAETNQLSRYRHRSHSRSRSPPSQFQFSVRIVTVCKKDTGPVEVQVEALEDIIPAPALHPGPEHAPAPAHTLIPAHQAVLCFAVCFVTCSDFQGRDERTSQIHFCNLALLQLGLDDRDSEMWKRSGNN